MVGLTFDISVSSKFRRFAIPTHSGAYCLGVAGAAEMPRKVVASLLIRGFHHRSIALALKGELLSEFTEHKPHEELSAKAGMNLRYIVLFYLTIAFSVVIVVVGTLLGSRR
jgi:hypothetical protein